MTDTATVPVPTGTSTLLLDYKRVAAGAVIALCLGVWIGFKVAGGKVADLADLPCADCADKAREADIIDAASEFTE